MKTRDSINTKVVFHVLGYVFGRILRNLIPILTTGLLWFWRFGHFVLLRTLPSSFSTKLVTQVLLRMVFTVASALVKVSLQFILFFSWFSGILVSRSFLLFWRGFILSFEALLCLFRGFFHCSASGAVFLQDFFGYLSILSVFCGFLCFKFGSSPEFLPLCSHFVSNLVFFALPYGIESFEHLPFSI